MTSWQYKVKSKRLMKFYCINVWSFQLDIISARLLSNYRDRAELSTDFKVNLCIIL